MHKERLNLNEPQPEEVEKMPEPPACLTGYGAAEWHSAGEELMRLRLLSVVDLPAFGAYCHAYQTWRTAADAIAKLATGDPVMSGLMIRTKSRGDVTTNPLVSIARKAALDMVRFAGEFGFTPSSRCRIDAGPNGNGAGKFDRFLA
jgi:P27 family predicted phage terminase small subunit